MVNTSVKEELVSMVKRFIQFKTDCGEVDFSKSFKDYGLDEFDVVELAFLLEDKFRIKIDPKITSRISIYEYVEKVVKEDEE